MKKVWEFLWDNYPIVMVVFFIIVFAVGIVGIVHETQREYTQQEIEQTQYDQRMRDAGCTGIYDQWYSSKHPKQWSCPPGVKP